MNRPKKSEYMKIGDTTTPYIFYQDRYMDALDIYCDHLEKSLDKACEKLTTDKDCLYDYDVCPFIYEDFENYRCGERCKNKESWKEWCLKDE